MLAALLVVAAEVVTIKIGNNTWTLGVDLIMYIAIAAIVGLIAEFIVGWRLPFGIIGAVLAALAGIWLMTQVIVISGVGDYFLFGVPIVRALIGAIILVGIWHLLTYGVTHRRRPTIHA